VTSGKIEAARGEKRSQPSFHSLALILLVFERGAISRLNRLSRFWRIINSEITPTSRRFLERELRVD